jgi:ABC-2 type transport system permease protein
LVINQIKIGLGRFILCFSRAEAAIGKAEIDAIVNIPSNFAEQYTNGVGVVQVITNGRSTSIASALQGYITSALNTASLIQADRTNAASVGSVITVEQRMWFNESANSTWFLVPGLIVLILTLVGAFLTGLLIARERERGTLEALYVTPVRPLEIVLSKLAPYIVIGMIDIVMCLVAAHVLFDVPIRASLFSVMSAFSVYARSLL